MVCVRQPSGDNVGLMLLSTPRTKHWVPSLLIAAIVLTLVGPALAAPPGPDALPVAVVAVKSDDALDQAEALTQALRKAVRDSEGWSLGEAAQALEFLALKMKCSEPIDAACEARIAEVINADRYLWCVIEFEGKDQSTVVGTLNFFEKGKGTQKHQLRFSGNLTDATDDSLVAVATDAVDAVTGGAPKGVLKLTTGGVAGQLYIDDKPLGALDADGGEFKLPAGRHRVVVKAKGYEDAETTVVVRPATSVDANVSMVEQEESADIDGRMIGGFASLGVGVVAGAIGLWQALEVNSIQTDADFEAFQAQVSSAEDVCEFASNNTPVNEGVQPTGETYANIAGKCDDASTAEIVQAVTFPLAALAAGIGAYLLGTSSLAGGDEEDDAVEAWSIQPHIGPDVQAISVGYRF
jgi:hypothetical protein